MTRYVPYILGTECNGESRRNWPQISLNLQAGCSNNCRYCSVSDNGEKQRRDGHEWSQQGLSTTPPIKTYPKQEGTVIFPTRHDITSNNLEEFIRVAKLVLKSGNELVIASKPRKESIDRLLIDLYPWISQIMFRFTIGCLDPDHAKFWEPGAPSPMERILCLESAYKSGFRTSVAIEPMLAGTIETTRVIDEVKPFTTDSIWLGKMDELDSRVSMTEPDVMKALEEIKRCQNDAAILGLYRTYSEDSQIFWKESITTVITRR